MTQFLLSSFLTPNLVVTYRTNGEMAGTYGRAGGSYQLVLKMPQLKDIYISLMTTTYHTYCNKVRTVCYLSFWGSLPFLHLMLASMFIPDYRVEKVWNNIPLQVELLPFPLASVTSGRILPSFTLRALCPLVALCLLVACVPEGSVLGPLYLLLTSSFPTISTIT